MGSSFLFEVVDDFGIRATYFNCLHLACRGLASRLFFALRVNISILPLQGVAVNVMLADASIFIVSGLAAAFACLLHRIARGRRHLTVARLVTCMVLIARLVMLRWACRLSSVLLGLTIAAGLQAFAFALQEFTSPVVDRWVCPVRAYVAIGALVSLGGAS